MRESRIFELENGFLIHDGKPVLDLTYHEIGLQTLLVDMANCAYGLGYVQAELDIKKKSYKILDYFGI